MMPVLVVESPAKAKTINSYLGSNYTVIASYGHVRDLPSKNGSVDPQNDFKMKWQADSNAQKQIKKIVDALKNDNDLILATDPDREGEAISWHVVESLKNRKVIKNDTPVKRVVFNAITKSSILEAMKSPREIDMPLVEAYLARVALDYLMGYEISPVLWRKLPGSRSAGRVQSPTLKLIVEREMEIESHVPLEYWLVEVILKNSNGNLLTAKLFSLDGKRVKDHDITSKNESEKVADVIKSHPIHVLKIESKLTKRNPSPPFMTATLQQEASRKLGLGAKQTMSVAQKLYEAGLITYMRTDGIDMDLEAIKESRSEIQKKYGKEYVPEKPRFYKNKARNAQEAHECIRPTNLGKSPKDLKNSDDIQKKLYELIWKRTISSQMASADIEETKIDLGSEKGEFMLRATGAETVFDGFKKVYLEGVDNEKENEKESSLIDLKKGEGLEINEVIPSQHFTQPKARYTEASLVKKMVELGIGRPSTYASVVSTIQDREYVRKEKNLLIPEIKGRLVTVFLDSYFNRYLEYEYTADLEKKLDNISAGNVSWKTIMSEFWGEFSESVSTALDLDIRDVLERITEVLTPHLFPEKEDGTDSRICLKCGNGILSVKTSKGSRGSAFIGCSNYPDCNYIRPMSVKKDEIELAGEDGKLMGNHENGEPVFLRTGRFGPFVQLGNEKTNIEKPKRSSIPKGYSIESIDLDFALKLLSLPREIGIHPDDGNKIEAAIGPYGPYIRHNKTYANVKDVEEIFIVGLNRAVELIETKKALGPGRRSSKVIRSIGDHPEGGSIDVMDGKFGKYVKWNKINATIPKNLDALSISLDEALKLINEKKSKKK